VVGDQHEIFGIHERLIRASSPFFDKAMSDKWQESLQRSIQLPDDEPKIFQLYVHWLYYDTFPVFSDEPGSSGNAEYLELIKAYILSDKLLDSRFQNAVIDAIIEKSVSKARDGSYWFPVGEAIDYAYSNTNESAPIRKLLVDLYVRHGCGSWLHDWGESASVPQPFLFELASKLLDRRDSLFQLKIEASNYHVHDSDNGEAKND
jgi:BTB/POZ domain